MSQTILLCLGMGYTARALARRLRMGGGDSGRGGDLRIIGTTRAPDKADGVRAAGATPLVTNSFGDAARAVADASHILVSAPPGAPGDPVLRALAVHIAAASRLRWIGYLSATSVYGDADGVWIDETAPLAPATERGRARAAAEEAWRDLAAAHDLPLVIFRLAGIYGPGRSAIDAIRAGRARRIVKPGQVFNRIHVEDAARMLAASMQAEARGEDGRGARYDPGAVYNLCDDEPAPPQDVIAYAAELLGADAPPVIPYAEAELSPMAASFYAENKRLGNSRVKKALGLELAFPTYREGLAAILRAQPE
ncbi:MAG: SDR family oxidoreductase [Parvularculaceae bacterium]